MSARNRKLKNPKHEKQGQNPQQLDLVMTTLTQMSSRLDLMTSLLLDIVLSEPNRDESVAYTDKAVLLEKLGLEIDEISRIVNKPSNYVSSRLREAKKRRSSRRQKRVTGASQKVAAVKNRKYGKREHPNAKK